MSSPKKGDVSKGNFRSVSRVPDFHQSIYREKKCDEAKCKTCPNWGTLSA